ncbi:MAG: hypothetical protein ACXVP0_11610 [Bacteroidia bacterium]
MKKHIVYTKHHLLLFIFLIASFFMNSQSGLQFVQVQHLDVAPNASLSISVPGGKVWKVESVSMGSAGTAPAVLLKNASLQAIAFFSSPVNGASAAYPYWLPSGFSGSFFNSNLSNRCSISITEYSVTP